MIKRDSGRYAKRQMTWFAADREVSWLDPWDVDAASKQIGLFLKRYRGFAFEKAWNFLDFSGV